MDLGGCCCTAAAPRLTLVLVFPICLVVTLQAPWEPERWRLLFTACEAWFLIESWFPSRPVFSRCTLQLL